MVNYKHVVAGEHLTFALLAERSSARPTKTEPSTPRRAVDGMGSLVVPGRWASRGSVYLPHDRVHCKKCQGPLRALEAAGELFVVCDSCERGAIAPPVHRALIEDLLQCR